MGYRDSRTTDASVLSKKYQMSENSLAFMGFHGIDILTQAVDHRWYLLVPVDIKFTQEGQDALQELAKLKLISLVRACEPLTSESSVSPSELRFSTAGYTVLESIVKQDSDYDDMRKVVMDCATSTWYVDNDAFNAALR